MSYTRQAIVRVPRTVIEWMLPTGKVIDLSADKIGEDLSWLEYTLKLPQNAKITGLSTNLYFDRDEIAIRIECSDFVRTFSGDVLPQINMMYEEKNGKINFTGWSGAALDKKEESSKIQFREFL